MQNLKRLGAAAVLTFMLGLSALAGEMNAPPCTPPDPGEMQGPPCLAPGQIEMPPAASVDPGETSTPPAEYSFTQLAITLLENAVFF